MKTSNIGVALVALVLVGAGSDSGGPGHEAIYEPASCPKPNIAGFPELDIPASAECGHLSVLEDA